MHIKQVFIFNACQHDEIKVDGHVVKERHKAPRKKPQEMDGLRVCFMADFELHKAMGALERIDSLYYNADEYRNVKAPSVFPVLGRKSVKIEIC